ncbi:interferon-induced very large GTPase 1-like [Anneissia japonica]|uniref:interferon-induced very large GTPase 1-like n=1 Tax=Anneissia japonica TaxID=1529436 RepID=UPI001425A864|nr:interferon-induced very large GTPase 1-like [Anneissia japonica]
MAAVPQFPRIIEQLGLKDVYPKKLTREKALEVSDDIATDGPKNAGDIPWFILRNLLLCNYEGRCFDVSQGLSFEKLGLSFSFDECHEASYDDDRNQISPSDALVALFWCCDDFLRQVLIEKMSICQLAIPLFLPCIDTNSHGIEVLIWAMSSLRKQWKTSSGSCDGLISMCRLPIMSVIRLGRPKISKSKILNHIISDLKHNIFFNTECDGGTLERSFSDGLLEITWYLPNGKNQDVFPEALTFLNLRGNASHLSGQTDFLSKISLATIAFVSSNEIKEEDIILLEKLYKQNGHFILVADGKPGEKLKEAVSPLQQQYLTITNKEVRFIGSQNKNDFQICREIRVLLNGICKEERHNIVPNTSIEMCIDVAKRMCFVIDENKQECVDAKDRANKMFNNLKTFWKGKRLPLQEISIKIGAMEKEKYQRRREGDMKSEEYSDKLQSDIMSLREGQKKIWDEYPELLDQFSSSYKLPVPERKYFFNYVKTIGVRESINELQKKRKEYNEKWTSLCEDLRDRSNRESQDLKLRRNELDNLESKINHFSLSLDNFTTEIGQMYEMRSYFRILDDSTQQFPVVAAELLLNGYPLQLMNSDASDVPLTWVEAVLTSLKEIIGDKRMFVLSVVGIQSSGKSTMLNAMFGLQCAGSCTKGVFAQLVPVKKSLQEKPKCDYILVVDSEGLRAPELTNIEHSNRDNKLATLVIGLADAAIINIMGENTTEIQDILQIVVYAFIKMTQVNIKPSCIFVHQNIIEFAAPEMFTTQKRKIKRMLDEITKCAAEEQNVKGRFQTFNDVIQFQEDKHTMFISSLLQGDPPMAPPNPSYSECILKVRKQIITIMQNSQAKPIEDVKCRISDLWKAIRCEDFVFSFRNTIDIRAFNALESKLLENSRKLRVSAMIYMNQLKVECKKLAANEIEETGQIILNDQLANLQKEVETFKKCMNEYFLKEKKACQWKGRTKIKMTKLCEDIRKEMTDEFVLLRTTIIRRNEIVSIIKHYEKDIVQKAKDLATHIFSDGKFSNTDLKRKFDDEWKRWVDVKSPFKLEDIDIVFSLKQIIQSSYLRFEKELNHMISSESHISSRSVTCQILVTEDDLNFDSWKGETTKYNSGRAVSKSACIDKAKSLIERLRSKVLQEISNFSHDGKNYTYDIGNSVVDFITMQLSELDEVTFKDRGRFRVTTRILLSVVPELKRLKEKYFQENDLRSYIETQKDRLWQMFRDECTTAEISTKAASTISRALEIAITSSLPNQCETAVINYLRNNTQSFANKMSFHAQMLIDLAERRDFNCYRKYLSKPHQYMRTYIEERIQHLCLHEIREENIPILQEIYCEKLDYLFAEAERAISATCTPSKKKCKISKLWPKLLSNIGNNLDVEKELRYFNEDCSLKLEDLKRMLLTGLRKSKEELTKAYNGHNILLVILSECQQFFEKDLLGCRELCPFCKAPCDLQAGDRYDDHRTEYHRPQGVFGYYLEDTKQLVTSVCTSSIMSDDTFRNEDTLGKHHPFKKYQTVNKFYNAWKIQPVEIESQLYWKWFMVNYNKILADYYGVKKADIPNEWKKISWESAKEAMIKTYNL